MQIATAQVLTFANESGLLAALAEGGGTVADLSRDLSLKPGPLRLVLDVLEVMGFAQRSGDAFALPSSSQQALEDTPMPIRAHLQLWQHLPTFVRDGSHFLRERDVEARDLVYQHVVAALGRRFQPLADELATNLASSGGEILDVGAGSGVWSLAMAERDDATRVTGLDGPDTVQVFRAEAERRGLGDRIDTLAGDYHQLALDPARYQRVILGNVLHLEPAPLARSLVQRTAPALSRNGEMIIVDSVRDVEPEHRLRVALYALHLGMRVAGSAVYARSDFEAWVEEAGLTHHRWVSLQGGLQALVARAA